MIECLYSEFVKERQVTFLEFLVSYKSSIPEQNRCALDHLPAGASFLGPCNKCKSRIYASKALNNPTKQA